MRNSDLDFVDKPLQFEVCGVAVCEAVVPGAKHLVAVLELRVGRG